MSRAKNFFEAVPMPYTIRDSRFGLRKLVNNPERPSIASYSAPGRGPNGEHQS
jgi:hypothetical protein